MVEQISAIELKSQLDAGEEFLLIDVREPFEHEEFNIGGRLLPLGSLLESASELEDSKDSKIVTYCRSGARSNMAAEALSNLGFNQVYNLQGGMINWIETFGR